MRGKRPERQDLRSRAEDRLRKRKVAPIDGKDTLRLLHELQVHQIELELQNEELQETRLALETALARQTELFDFAPVGYFVVERRGDIREVNFAGARLLGLPRSEVVERPFATFVSMRDIPAWEQFVTEILTDDFEVGKDRPARTLELAFLSSEGIVLVRLTAEVADGPAPAVLVAAEDITARRQAEDALQQELRRRDDFLGTLSHELRNPLAPIRNGLYLLQHSDPGTDPARRALAIVDRQVFHLTRIVDDLLDVTRIARGKLALKRKVEDLAEIVRRTVEDHRNAFDEGGVALRLRVPEEPCFADVDATRMAQVLGNLLANALKFTKGGGAVDVELWANGTELRLGVRDTGAGISETVLARLFQPFAQGPQSLARSAGGLGLGLATVRGLVGLHDGTVGITSAGPGFGTEVTIRLPGSPTPSRRGAPAPAHAPAHRILVIDDNVDAASTLRDVLETQGHAVRTAHDAEGGLATARDFLPEVVLCDIGLPGPDGYTVARALRADPALQAAWLIALSGYARPEDVRRSLDAGFDRHVAKPTSLDTLTTLLAEATPRPAKTPAPSAR